MSLEIFKQVQKSAWCRIFKLTIEDQKYICSNGKLVDTNLLLETIKKTLVQKIGSFRSNDGRQTPYYKHYSFKAQHATRSCCRKCLLKTYGIRQDHQLTNQDLQKILGVIRIWIDQQKKYIVGIKLTNKDILDKIYDFKYNRKR